MQSKLDEAKEQYEKDNALKTQLQAQYDYLIAEHKAEAAFKKLPDVAQSWFIERNDDYLR